MEFTKLPTVEQVRHEIRRIVDERHPRGPRRADQLKPADERAELARLADLYELRMQMWRDLAITARQADTIPDAYAEACALAEIHDRNQMQFWRSRAEAR